MKITRLYRIAIVLAGLIAPALTQSLPNLPLTRLGYTVRKRTVNPQGDMKNRIDALDAQLNEETRRGNLGEVRRLLAKGMVLLAGNEWTDALDFKHSLTLRADRAFVDTSHPFT